MAEIKLEAKLVGQLEGEFQVPSYQRGYRWGKSEVLRLLDDVSGIYDAETHMCRNYCLQPVVVKKKGNYYELIDGQQRLTTLYLIYQYMHQSSGGFLEKPKFTLNYETRTKSAKFLQDMDMAREEENIDFWHMCNAYKVIESWFEKKGKKSVAMQNLNKYLEEDVKVIWYEVGESEDAIAFFARLNIGKIPLTSAELVKAMFLSRSGQREMKQERQEEIALQWDAIEKDLSQSALWYFLTNCAESAYQTRVDLILDLISGKPENDREPYFTFFYFDSLRQEKDLDEIWQDILHTFYSLKDWFGNHELYHKAGYLIASRSKKLSELYLASKGMAKSAFRAFLDEAIRESVAIDGNYADLSYEKAGDYRKISRLLLLFNVESVRRNGEHTQWFPFDKFKFQENGRVSLEHIHAQQSEGMKKQEEWKEWVKLHIPSIQALGDGQEELVEEMRAMLGRKLLRQDFERVQERVIAKLSVQGNREYLHTIANLALIHSGGNAALSNSAFDVKRNAIIEMDKRGMYIPFCTKMVFLKYYTPSEENQLHFWGQQDRIAYVQAINSVLGDYLEERIGIEQEGK